MEIQIIFFLCRRLNTQWNYNGGSRDIYHNRKDRFKLRTGLLVK
jgi:hypothetical protein